MDDTNVKTPAIDPVTGLPIVEKTVAAVEGTETPTVEGTETPAVEGTPAAE
jgi:hypothetical protein